MNKLISKIKKREKILLRIKELEEQAKELEEENHILLGKKVEEICEEHHISLADFFNLSNELNSKNFGKKEQDNMEDITNEEI